MESWILGIYHELYRFFTFLFFTKYFTESENAQEELKKFVDLCTLHNVPCHMFHLSSGYSLGKDGKRYVFEWNHNRVPDPSKMVQYFHDAKIRISANIKPCLLTSHPQYEKAKEEGCFITDPKTKSPTISKFWGGDGSYLDFTNPKAWQWWQRNIRESLFSHKIDSTWNDNNEYEIWDDTAECNGFGTPISIGKIRPIMPLLMMKCSFDAQVENQKDVRPLVCRSIADICHDRC